MRREASGTQLRCKAVLIEMGTMVWEKNGQTEIDVTFDYKYALSDLKGKSTCGLSLTSGVRAGTGSRCHSPQCRT